MTTNSEALDKAIQKTCDGSVADFAKRLNLSPQVVFNWRRRGVPALKVNAVVRACAGAVAAHELRPDLPDLFPPPPGGQSEAA